MKISHSIISESYITEMILDGYVLGESIECVYLLQGLNDSYLILADGSKYIFRVYRYGRRTAALIDSEIEYISYLSSQSTLVAGPISDKDGIILQALECPEGTRLGFLMQCAENTKTESHCLLTGDSISYGQSIAKVHKHSATFKPKESFRKIDLDYLIWRPLSLIEEYFESVDVSYASNLAKRVANELADLDQKGLVKSFLHGDITGGNACLSDKTEYVFFDFDCCGYGWLAYDLATFYWSSIVCHKEKSVWNDFIEGYKSVSELSEMDISAIPLLAIARQFWIIGYSIEQMKVKGALSYKLRNLEQDLNFFRVLESKQGW